MKHIEGWRLRVEVKNCPGPLSRYRLGRRLFSQTIKSKMSLTWTKIALNYILVNLISKYCQSCIKSTSTLASLIMKWGNKNTHKTLKTSTKNGFCTFGCPKLTLMSHATSVGDWMNSRLAEWRMKFWASTISHFWDAFVLFVDQELAKKPSMIGKWKKHNSFNFFRTLRLKR